MKFCTTVIPVGGQRLRVFVGMNPLEAYALISDLAPIVSLKTDSVRAELSRHNLGHLVAVPELKRFLKDEMLIPQQSGKVNFALSDSWMKLVKRHVTDDVMSEVEVALEDALLKAQERDQSDMVEIICDVHQSQRHDLTPASDEKYDSRLTIHDVEETPLIADSPMSDCSESDCSSSASSSDSFDEVDSLPNGVSDWVITAPLVPTQFSRSDYCKSYSLKDYDINKSLKKELNKMRKWWTKKENRERSSRSEKAVSDTTSFKREERVLCFLGFVAKYECIPGNRCLTLALVLNHKLFRSFLRYMQEVRECKPGTLAEALTAAIFVCKWLFRKDLTTPVPPIMRRYMDWRNEYQASAARDRKLNDKEELKEKNKWLEWTRFTEAVKHLREDWERVEHHSLNSKSAHQLHDLLLLGIYACIPSRGSEVRLLEYLPEAQVIQLKGEKTFKEFVKAQQINLLTQKRGVWTMIISQFKNASSKGVDTTDLSKFQWWTDLAEVYIQDGYWDLMKRHNKHSYLFMTGHGERFQTGYFSDYIARRIEKLIGVHVATNAIRSSFITHFYNSDASRDPLLCESVASVMRHTTNEARRTYDRRNSSERKKKGLDFILNEQNLHGKSDLHDDETPIDFDKRLHMHKRLKRTRIDEENQ